MSVRLWLKTNAADRVLSPLRNEVIGMIQPGARVFEVGCGTGDLLLRCAQKISSGYGVDIDDEMIRHARSRCRESGLDNLQFDCIDARLVAPGSFDIATSTLCLHEMSSRAACDILELMVDRSNTVLIADYSGAKTTRGKLGMEMDELVSGHYRNYRAYRKGGEIPAYASKVGAVVHQQIASVIDGIAIWRIGKRHAEP